MMSNPFDLNRGSSLLFSSSISFKLGHGDYDVKLQHSLSAHLLYSLHQEIQDFFSFLPPSF